MSKTRNGKEKNEAAQPFKTTKNNLEEMLLIRSGKRIEGLRIGDIVVVEIHGEGHTQDGTRPAVIIQNDVGTRYSPNVIVFPFTGKIKKTHMPTHVCIPAGEAGLNKDSMVLCENPITVPQDRISKKIGPMSPKSFSKVCSAALISMPFDQYTV